MNTLKVIYVSFLALTANSLLAAVVFTWNDTILYQPFKDETGVVIELRKCPHQNIKSYQDCPLEEGVSPATITDTESDLISGLERAARSLLTRRWYSLEMTRKIRFYQDRKLHSILRRETEIKSSIAKMQEYMDAPGYYATDADRENATRSLREDLTEIEQELMNIFQSRLIGYPTGQWTDHRHYYAEFKAAVQEIELIIKALALEITSPDVITYNSRDEAQKLKIQILRLHYDYEKWRQARKSLTERRCGANTFDEMISIYKDPVVVAKRPKELIINNTENKISFEIFETEESEPFRNYSCD